MAFPNLAVLLKGKISISSSPSAGGSMLDEAGGSALDEARESMITNCKFHSFFEEARRNDDTAVLCLPSLVNRAV
jgi:hypothetical protein